MLVPALPAHAAGPGKIDRGLSEALKVSCDCFFYQYGIAAGIENMDHIGKLLGIGEYYDLGLDDEKAGVMPGPEWLRNRWW